MNLSERVSGEVTTPAPLNLGSLDAADELFMKLVSWVEQFSKRFYVTAPAVPTWLNDREMQGSRSVNVEVATGREILRKAGRGDYGAGAAVPATEVFDRSAGSERTRDKKALFDRQAIGEQASVALERDGKLFSWKGAAGSTSRSTIRCC